MHAFAQLVAQFEDKLIHHFSFPDSPATLYEPSRYFLAIGGKRVRPVLCLMGNELFGEIQEDAWNAALGIELFHNFTLIHDDIMDKAPIRRGSVTLHERNGLTAGILCGDVINIYAYQQLARIRHALPQILQLFNTTSIEVCEGQQLDMDFENRDDVRIDEYIRMITLKTSVLLACALKMGALIGGATEGNARKLYEFGKNLGIAFQLQDDYLDAFGKSDKIGKLQGGDIVANKKTLLLLKAQELASPLQREAIDSHLKDSSDNKVTAMLQLYKDTGADEACKDLVKQYSASAYECLEDVAVLSKRKQPLLDLADYLLHREQ